MEFRLRIPFHILEEMSRVGYLIMFSALYIESIRGENAHFNVDSIIICASVRSNTSWLTKQKEHPSLSYFQFSECFCFFHRMHGSFVFVCETERSVSRMSKGGREHLVVSTINILISNINFFSVKEHRHELSTSQSHTKFLNHKNASDYSLS